MATSKRESLFVETNRIIEDDILLSDVITAMFEELSEPKIRKEKNGI